MSTNPRGVNKRTVKVTSVFGEVWQHPYADVLKLANIGGNHQQAVVEGDVKKTMVREIGRTALIIRGNVPQANFIRIPTNASQSLWLDGPFAYILLKANPTKNFVFHIDVHTKDNPLVIRLSFSNMFKGCKNLGLVVQFALATLRNKWTMFCMDLAAIMKESTLYEFHRIKAVQICSVLQVRSFFTSQRIYTPTDVPRDVSVPVPRGGDWIDSFDWLWCPRVPKPHIVPPTSTRQEVHLHRSTSRDEEDEDLRPKSTPPTPMKHPCVPLHNASQGCEIDDRNRVVERPYFLFPDPIMTLREVVGYSAKTAPSISWINGSSRELLYVCDNMVIRNDLSKMSRTPVSGHARNITLITARGRLMVTGQEGKRPLLRLWDIEKNKCVADLTAQESSLVCAALSTDCAYLAVVGYDSHNRLQIIVWDVRSVLQDSHLASVVAKQTSEFSIKRIDFLPTSQGEPRLLTCGRESIRFWRIKSNHLPGHSLALNEHARTTFTSIAVENPSVSEGADLICTPHVFVSSESGLVFQIDSATSMVQAVYSLYNCPIRSIAVTEAFCITGTEEGEICVWHLDFSGHEIRSRLDSSITSIAISPDGLRAAVGTVRGSLGVLDIVDNAYEVIANSHTDSVVALAVSAADDEFATASADRTIRVWDVETCQLTYEFPSDDEVPCVLSYHPKQNELACGFHSGLLRVYDVPSTRMLVEYRQHRGAIRGLVYSPDSRRLYVAGADDQICVHDAVRQYEPVRVLSAAFNDQDTVSIDVSVDGQYFAAPSPTTSSEIVVYYAESLVEKTRIKLHHSIAVNLKFSKDSNEIFIVCNDRRFLRFSLHNPDICDETFFAGSLSKQTSLDFSPGGQFVVTSGIGDRMVRVWTYRSDRAPAPSQRFSSNWQGVTSVKFAGGSSVICCSGSAIMMWTFHGKEDIVAPTVGDTHEELDRSSGQLVPGEPSPSRIAEIPELQQASSPLIDKSHREMVLPADDGLTRCSPVGTDDREMNFIHALPKIAYLRLKTLPETTPAINISSGRNTISHFLGYDGNGRGNIGWNAQSGSVIYSVGNATVLLKLADMSQCILGQHPEQISALAISPNGALIVAGGSDSAFDSTTSSSLYRWDRESCLLKAKLEYHTSGVQAMSFSDSSRYLVSIGSDREDGSLCVWDLQCCEQVGFAAVSDAVPNRVMALYGVVWLHRSTRTFVTVGSRGVLAWEISASRRGSSLTKELSATHFGGSDSTGACTAIAVLENDCIAVGTTLGDVLLWRMSGNSRVYLGKVASTVSSEITILSWRDGKLDIAGVGPLIHRISFSVPLKNLHQDGSQNVIEITSKETIELPCDTDVIAGAFGGDGSSALVGTTSNTVFQLDWTMLKATRFVCGHEGLITQLMTCPVQPKYLVSAGHDGTLRVWNSAMDYAVVLHYHVVDEVCNALAIHPGKGIIAAGFSDGNVRLIELEYMKLCGTIALESGEVSAVAYIDGGEMLSCGMSTGAIHIVDPVNLKVITEIWELQGSPIHSLDASSTQASMWLATSAAGALSVWAADNSRESMVNVTTTIIGNADQRTVPAEMTICPPVLAKFLQSERNIIVCSADSCIHFFDVTLSTIVRKISLQHSPASISVSSISPLIVLGTYDRLVIVINYDTGAIETVAKHCDMACSVAFSADGQTLFSASRGAVAVHNIAFNTPSHHDGET